MLNIGKILLDGGILTLLVSVYLIGVIYYTCSDLLLEIKSNLIPELVEISLRTHSITPS